MNFSSKSNEYALKVSVGDVNALTGYPRLEVRHDERQDYVVVNCSGGQPYVYFTLAYCMCMILAITHGAFSPRWLVSRYSD